MTPPTRRVLLVEDDRVTAESLEVLLRARGCETVTAATAHEALTRLALWPPDMVVVDVCLPGQDGLAFLADLRAVPGPAALTPAVLITAAADAEGLEARAAGLGARLVRKPFDLPELLAALGIADGGGGGA